MPKRSPEKVARRATERISRLRDTIAKVDCLCSGTLLKRMMKCGKPNCRCRHDPAARHGPYYEWGRMKAGKLAHRYVSPEQADLLRQAIANYRKVKKAHARLGGGIGTAHRRQGTPQIPDLGKRQKNSAGNAYADGVPDVPHHHHERLSLRRT